MSDSITDPTRPRLPPGGGAALGGGDGSGPMGGAEGPAATVLVVDDEKNIRRTLGLVLEGAGYRVLEAASAEEALGIMLSPRHPIDLAIVDLKLPQMSGLDLLALLGREEACRGLPILVISGHASVEEAVRAIKLGASDFFEKPLSRDRILVSVANGIRAARLSRKVEHLSAELERRYQMVGTSTALKRLFADIDRVAPTRATVLITGESGTGKELVSRALHRLSPRKDAPFIKVNCAAIPRELIDSELFGHEKGAFTGALTRKRGVFEQAHGGTLFLDEIGDMDLAAQAKVLRVLQSGEMSRVGSEHCIEVDVRVLAATNKELPREVAQGRFREDLFFRLEVFPISVPALRERTEDIPLLAHSFVEAFCRDNGLRSKRIDPEFLQALGRRVWPGNVRELKNVVERAAILSSDIITIADLAEDPHQNPFEELSGGEAPLLELGDDAPAERAALRTSLPPGALGSDGEDGALETAAEQTGEVVLTLRQYRDAAERRYIVETLQATDWNISRAAARLGVERTNLHKKIRAYAIVRGER